MKEQNDKIMSYLVTLGFIIFILLFLSSLVFLSRLVLSQDSQLGSYVSSTQDLLKEIDRVQREVLDVNITRNNTYISFPNNVSVNDMSSITTRSGKSYITFTLDRPTFIENSMLFFEPLNINEIDDGNLVLLESGIKGYALYSGEESYDFSFYLLENRTFIQGDFETIRGVLLYEIRKENYNST